MKSGNLKITKMYEDTHREIIEIGLVEMLSTRTACHLVTKGFPDIHGYPWIIHGYAWT